MGKIHENLVGDLSTANAHLNTSQRERLRKALWTENKQGQRFLLLAARISGETLEVAQETLSSLRAFSKSLLVVSNRGLATADHLFFRLRASLWALKSLSLPHGMAINVELAELPEKPGLTSLVASIEPITRYEVYESDDGSRIAVAFADGRKSARDAERYPIRDNKITLRLGELNFTSEMAPIPTVIDGQPRLFAVKLLERLSLPEYQNSWSKKMLQRIFGKENLAAALPTLERTIERSCVLHELEHFRRLYSFNESPGEKPAILFDLMTAENPVLTLFLEYCMSSEMLNKKHELRQLPSDELHSVDYINILRDLAQAREIKVNPNAEHLTWMEPLFERLLVEDPRRLSAEFQRLYQNRFGRSAQEVLSYLKPVAQKDFRNMRQ